MIQLIFISASRPVAVVTLGPRETLSLAGPRRQAVGPLGRLHPLRQPIPRWANLPSSAP